MLGVSGVFFSFDHQSLVLPRSTQLSGHHPCRSAFPPRLIVPLGLVLTCVQMAPKKPAQLVGEHKALVDFIVASTSQTHELAVAFANKHNFDRDAITQAINQEIDSGVWESASSKKAPREEKSSRQTRTSSSVSTSLFPTYSPSYFVGTQLHKNQLN